MFFLGLKLLWIQESVVARVLAGQSLQRGASLVGHLAACLVDSMKAGGCRPMGATEREVFFAAVVRSAQTVT